MTCLIRPLKMGDLEGVRRFTDREIGAGYYSTRELRGIFARSIKQDVMCSLVLEDLNKDIQGVRITYPPGLWDHGKGCQLSSPDWPHPLEHTGYFQSLFIAEKCRGEGWGGRMSKKSLACLREVGAKGVVCHSWKESPNNSSSRYLAKLGFEIVTEYPLYWKDVNYNCTRCLRPPCQCTAQEMYLDLERNYEHLFLA